MGFNICSVDTKPLYFRNNPFRAGKGFCKGTHRLCSPDETYEKIVKSTFDCGLTRHADITGLDCIGLPVTLAIRPNSMTLAVSSGKGLTQMAALVSGYMEAYELYHCERYPFPTLLASYEEIKQKYLAPHPHQFPMKKNALFHEKWPMRWVIGWDLVTQGEIALPLMAVSLDYRLLQNSPFFELNPFERTSNGVSSGNHFLEAVCSGIYEVIERDAIYCHSYAQPGYFPPKVNLGTIHDDPIASVLDKIKRGVAAVELFDCSVDTGVHVFEAFIYDDQVRGQGVGMGYGAHLDPETAMLRAITEALQGRLVYISGARDDIFSSNFQLFKKSDDEKSIAQIKNKEAVIDPRSYVDQSMKTFEEEIHVLIEKLAAVGVAHVVVFNLAFDHSPFPVVKVVIPGLEGYPTPTCVAGTRAQKFLRSKIQPESCLDSPLSFWHRPAGELK